MSQPQPPKAPEPRRTLAGEFAELSIDGRGGAPGPGSAAVAASAPAPVPPTTNPVVDERHDPGVDVNGAGNSSSKTIYYTSEKVIGNGSFGVVFQAVCAATGEVVAIKKVLQDRKFKNRELQIMRMLDHPNIVKLKHCFYSNGETGDKVYLNLVQEFVPQTVYRVCRYYAKQRRTLPLIYVKLYTYQLCRSLAYLHSMGICHRDIKPQNLLVDTVTGVLKLCDFGSSKVLRPGEPSVAYICSRYYRAPELVFGTTFYDCSIDIWSLGCVLAELLLGQPIFPGETGIDQLVEIIKVIGSPTQQELRSMNQNYMDFKFPFVKPHAWSKVFRGHTDKNAVDLVSKFLVYTPHQRLGAAQALSHPFFAELRLPTTRMPDGRTLPPLFNFNAQELTAYGDLYRSLVPEHFVAGGPPAQPPSAPAAGVSGVGGTGPGAAGVPAGVGLVPAPLGISSLPSAPAPAAPSAAAPAPGVAGVGAMMGSEVPPDGLAPPTSALAAAVAAAAALGRDGEGGRRDQAGDSTSDEDGEALGGGAGGGGGGNGGGGAEPLGPSSNPTLPAPA